MRNWNCVLVIYSVWKKGKKKKRRKEKGVRRGIRRRVVEVKNKKRKAHFVFVAPSLVHRNFLCTLYTSTLYTYEYIIY